MGVRARAAWVLAVVAGTWGCVAQEAVVRVIDGEQVTGRFVDERAYDAYLRASILEQEGQLEAAETAYQEAVEADSEGAGPLVRLAAVRCALGGARTQGANEAFARALELSPSYAPLYVERGKCALSRGQPEAAEKDARAALSLDPKDAEASLLLAKLLERSGRGAEAVALLHGYVTWRPQAAEVWQELREAAHRTGARAHEGLARERPLRSSFSPSEHRRREPGEEALSQIDRLIVRKDTESARAASLAAGLSAGELAVRAAALGQWGLAQEQAAMVLAADPTDPDARAAAMALPDLRPLRESLGERVWQQVRDGNAGGLPGPLGVLVVADAVARRVGLEAALPLVRTQEGRGVNDPLVAALRARLTSR